MLSPSPALTQKSNEEANMSRIMRGAVSNTLALVAGPLTVSGHAALGVALVIAATALAVTISKPR